MKYETTLRTLDENSSQAQLLRRVKPGAAVLECGCATGYMTRFLREELHCTVSIFERDPEGYRQALPHATDGVCADLEQDEGWETFKGRLFDVILFADVLEHLTDARAVLRRASEYLTPEGVILCSLPNIGHNDILLKLYAQHWDVTPCGLLDESHLHFWAYHNLPTLCTDTPLTLTEIDGIPFPTAATEQAPYPVYALPSAMVRTLVRRDYGEIYQFILTLRHRAFAEAQCLPCATPIERYRRPSRLLRREAWYSYLPGLRALRNVYYRRTLGKTPSHLKA